jgi:hypothetical protein
MKTMYFSPDVSEFLFLLFKHKVRYLIVGGEAVIYYGHARLTGDIDLFYDRENNNIQKLYSTLTEFWNSNIPGIKSKDELMKEGMVFQFGVPPNRIDLINRIEKVNFDSAWKNRKNVSLIHKRKKFRVHYIGLKELIENKKAVNRFRDKDDLEFLESVISKAK